MRAVSEETAGKSRIDYNRNHLRSKQFMTFTKARELALLGGGRSPNVLLMLGQSDVTSYPNPNQMPICTQGRMI